MTTPHAADPRDDEHASARPEPTDAGGESACWAHLVCEECGALEHDGHRQGCRSGPGY